MQPAKLRFGLVHQTIKVVEELISEEGIVREVKLSSSIPERVVVALSREVEPLGMTKLITLKVKVSLSSKSMRDQPDHLV